MVGGCVFVGEPSMGGGYVVRQHSPLGDYVCFDIDDDDQEEDALYVDVSWLGVNIISSTVVYRLSNFTSQMMCKV